MHTTLYIVLFYIFSSKLIPYETLPQLFVFHSSLFTQTLAFAIYRSSLEGFAFPSLFTECLRSFTFQLLGARVTMLSEPKYTSGTSPTMTLSVTRNSVTLLTVEEYVGSTKLTLA